MKDITLPGDKTVFEYLEDRCKENSLNLTAICDAAQVHTSQIWRWKHTEPTAFDTLRKMDKAIDDAIEKK